MEHFSPKIVEAVETVKTSPSVQRAFDYVKDHLEETIRDQKELVLIEAPTGHEKAKAERYLSMLREAGLDDIYMDELISTWTSTLTSSASCTEPAIPAAVFYSKAI